MDILIILLFVLSLGFCASFSYKYGYKQAEKSKKKEILAALENCKVVFSPHADALNLYLRSKHLLFDISKGHISYSRLPVGSKALGNKDKVSCWFVLGIMPTKDKSKVISAYKKMALVYHPDQGGDSKSFQFLTKAKDLALKNCEKAN